LKRYLWLHEATVANQTLALQSHPVSSSHNRRVAFSPYFPPACRGVPPTPRLISSLGLPGPAAPQASWRGFRNAKSARGPRPELLACCVADGLSRFLNLLLAFTGNDE
jgi:hypothetical protein